MKYIYYSVFLFCFCILLGCATDVNVIGGSHHTVRSQDAGDCIDISRCPYPVDKQRDVYAVSFEGNTAENVGEVTQYIEALDLECRQLGIGQWGADIDYIPIQTEPGTPLEVTVQSVDGSLAQPIASLLAENGGELIFAKPHYGRLTLSFLAPGKLFYIRVEESQNYTLNYLDACSQYLLGGEKYQYEVKVETSGMQPISLGNIDSDRSFQGTLARVGDVHYYRFTAAQALKFKVALVDADHSLSVAQIDRNVGRQSYAGGYQWMQYGKALKPENGGNSRELDVAYADCLEGQCEYWIAVTDFEANSEYTYEIRLTLR